MVKVGAGDKYLLRFASEEEEVKRSDDRGGEDIERSRKKLKEKQQKDERRGTLLVTSCPYAVRQILFISGQRVFS
jgi:hypothetical protein